MCLANDRDVAKTPMASKLVTADAIVDHIQVRGRGNDVAWEQIRIDSVTTAVAYVDLPLSVIAHLIPIELLGG